MAEVLLDLGGRRHPVQCRDGEEDALRTLGAMLDTRWDTAQRAAGHVGGERALLFVALLLADDLADAEARAPTPEAVADDADADADALAHIAERLETLADALEQASSST